MMKKISIFLFAAAALFGVGCEDNSDVDKVTPVSAISLDSSLSGGIALEVGQTLNIAGKVTILPEDATNKTESYKSSDAQIVTVDESGLVKAIKPGLAMITISVGGKHSHFEVSVETRKVPVETLTLPAELADGVTLKIGQTLEIAGKVTITPANATNTAESYESSAPMIASVSNEGLVTAIEIGETTITIAVDGKSVRFGLTVEKIAVESVTLPEELTKGVTLDVGATLDIAGKASVAPQNATFKTESYASSDTSVATVSSEGVVTTLKVGRTTITVTVDGIEASFELTVAAEVAVALEKIEIKDGANATQGSTSIVLGSSKTEFDLNSMLQLTPANQNEGVKFVAFGSDEIATIDEKGIITCKGVGTVTFVVLAKSNTTNDFKNAGDKKAYFAINITDPKDLDRTNWLMSASGQISGTGGSATSAFDGKFDPCAFKTAMGTNVAMNKPGKNGAGSEIWFVVDMQKEQSVNYLRLLHQSSRNTDRGCRWQGFSQILGSNDGENFTSIATNVAIPSWAMEFAEGIDPNDGGKRNIDKYHNTPNIKFPKTVSYRYLKFVGTASNFLTANSTCQFSEFYLGLDE